MGTSGTAIFKDDLATEIRQDYLHNLTIGCSNAKATRDLLEASEEYLDDVDDAPIVWFALAEIQWQMGRLEERVKKKALKLIEAGGDVARWEEAGEARFAASRRKVLAALAKRLQSKQPPEKPVRVKKPKPPKYDPHDWKVGDVYAYRLRSGKFVLLQVEYIYQTKELLLTVLDFCGKRIPPAARIKRLKVKQALHNYFDTPVAYVVHMGGWQQRDDERLKKLDVRRPDNKVLRKSPTHVEGVAGTQSYSTWDGFDGDIARHAKWK